MDNVQLRYVSDLGRYEHSHVGTHINGACNRVVLVWYSVLFFTRYWLMAYEKKFVGAKYLPAITLRSIVVRIVTG